MVGMTGMSFRGNAEQSILAAERRMDLSKGEVCLFREPVGSTVRPNSHDVSSMHGISPVRVILNECHSPMANSMKLELPVQDRGPNR